MMQNILVLVILGVAFFFVFRRFWRTTRNVSKGSCGCGGCGPCPDSEKKTEQSE